MQRKQPTTIDGVIASLTDIIEDCWQRNSRLGFFPAMYRKVTMRIRDGIDSGQFENGERLERFDISFANRYIAAFEQHRRGLTPTRSWAYAFQMAAHSYPMIVQHLLLGMNAHINLDLGIAAAEISGGTDLFSLKRDFVEVNQVLASMLDEVQSGVNDSSPLYRILDRLGWRVDEAICNFSIRHARRAAWSKAIYLHQLQEPRLTTEIEEIDRGVASLARLICPPGTLGSILYQMISDSETQQPRQIIEELA
jgi:hypothetical protein